MAFGANFDFLKMGQFGTNVSSAGAIGNNGSKGNNGVNGNSFDLKNTDIFTAEKNGVQAKNTKDVNKQQPLKKDENTKAKNAFGKDMQGYNTGMDTVEFSTKANKTEESNSIPSGAVKTGSGMNFANNNNELQKIAEELGCEADENTIKNKLSSMDTKSLSKLDGDLIDTAEDLGLITMAEVEKKAGTKNQENEPEKNNPFKFKFGDASQQEMV